MKISPEVISSFKPAKIFTSNENIINSMDFTPDGSLLITASDDESMKIYSCDTGFKKYGVDLIRFTHNTTRVLCASKNNWDETIRYLSLQDNRYLRYYKGHRDKVLSLNICPINETFISSSLDGTVRFWDINESGCQGVLRLKRDHTSFIGYSVATSYDPHGLILAVAMGKNTLKLYDTRSYDKGPFSTYKVTCDHELYWHNMEFSNDGSLILLTTPNSIIVVDSFKGDLVQYINISNTLKYPLKASFSPDGQFILCGTTDGLINIWNSSNGNLVAVWRGEVPHPGPVGNVLFNPKKMMAVSACSQLSFWLPDIQ